METSNEISGSLQPNKIRNRADYRLFLLADMQAHGLSTWRWYLRYKYPELYFQRALRRVEYLMSNKTLVHRTLYLVARLYLARLSLQSGISIPPGVFGPGLSIAHYGSIVVNDRARVGAYCRIHSATNIGIGKSGVPRIGDFVYIGPGAVISGGITVGDRSAIGANAVVRRDVPQRTVVAGVPAKTISDESSYESMPDAIQTIMNCHDH
ncbi:serine O-acetyltransferase [Arthrobacter sp. M-10]|uniref:serine O-acetyltransferase n=1 Tax=Arthrobacter sp. M-10 TaxID=3233037 RepID=UPI003F90CC38